MVSFLGRFFTIFKPICSLLIFLVFNCGKIIAGTAEQKIHPKCWQILHTHCFYNREGENTLKQTSVCSDISTDQVIHLAATPCYYLAHFPYYYLPLLLLCSDPLLLPCSNPLLLPCSDPICSFW